MVCQNGDCELHKLSTSQSQPMTSMLARALGGRETRDEKGDWLTSDSWRFSDISDLSVLVMCLQMGGRGIADDASFGGRRRFRDLTMRHFFNLFMQGLLSLLVQDLLLLARPDYLLYDLHCQVSITTVWKSSLNVCNGRNISWMCVGQCGSH